MWRTLGLPIRTVDIVSWGIPPFVMLPKVLEQFHKLSEVHVQPKDFGNCLRVEMETIGGQLDLYRTRRRFGIGNYRGASQSFVGFTERGITGGAAPNRFSAAAAADRAVPGPLRARLSYPEPPSAGGVHPHLAGKRVLISGKSHLGPLRTISTLEWLPTCNCILGIQGRGPR
jgi:hypothetical protein